MPFFQGVFDRLGFLSSSNPESSDSGASSSGMGLAERLDRQRMSPNTRTKAWLNAHSPPKYNDRSATPSVLSVGGGRVSKHAGISKTPLKSACKSTSKTPTKSVKFSSEPVTKNKRFSLWNALVGFRYKTEEEAVTPVKSEGQYEGSTLFEDDVTVVSTDVLEGDTLVQDDKGDLHKENEHDFSDFTNEEYFLFHKLNERGFEPILNFNWHWHFSTFPPELFTLDPTQAYISHTKGPEHHGIKFLRLLVDAGLRVRERFQLNLTPEKPLYDALNKYYKWTMQDAQLTHKEHIPLLDITCVKKGESVASLIGRCTDRLHSLGRQYRDMWRIGHEGDDVQRYSHELPTIFGIVITFSVVGFVTYDARYPGKAVRSMGNWDFGNEGQDVWHAFAVAIFMICARNYLMGLEEEGLLGPEMESESDDPDA